MNNILLSIIFWLATGPKGKVIDGIYVSTHITECVDFCEDRGKVDRMYFRWSHRSEIQCICGDGTSTYLKTDPYSPLLEE